MGIFVLEQESLYQDIDNADLNACHLMLKQQDKLIAYLRILAMEDCKFITLGRFVIQPKLRGQGIASSLFKQALALVKRKYPNKTIKISAQYQLEGYYQAFGFNSIGEPYDDAGVLHIEMLLDKKQEERNKR